MTMNVWSASKASQLISCPGSLLLPWTHTTNKAAERGTAAHAYIASNLPSSDAEPVTLGRGSKWPQCVDIGAIYAYCAKDGGVWHCEQGLGYDFSRSRAFFLESKQRDYKPQPGWIYGTADLIIERTSGPHRLSVVDFKTGADVGDPKTNWQMRTLGLMAARAYNMPGVFLGIMYIDKVCDVYLDERSGFVNIDVLDATEEAIRRSLASDEINPSVDACRYCPAKTHCLEAL